MLSPKQKKNNILIKQNSWYNYYAGYFVIVNNKTKIILPIGIFVIIVLITVTTLLYCNSTLRIIKSYANTTSTVWNIKDACIDPESQRISIYFQDDNSLQSLLKRSNIAASSKQGLTAAFEICSNFPKALKNNLGAEYDDYSFHLQFQDRAHSMYICYEIGNEKKSVTKLVVNSCYNLSLDMVADNFPNLKELYASTIMVDDIKDFEKFNNLEVVDIWDHYIFSAKDREYITSLFPNAQINVWVIEK